MLVVRLFCAILYLAGLFQVRLASVIQRGNVLPQRCLTLSYSQLRATCSESKIREPIILLHGLLGASRNFRTFERLLHEKLQGCHDIICMDARNHGATAAMTSNIGSSGFIADYEVMANDVIGTMDSLLIERAHIVGHSMGGKTASMAALLNSHRFESLSVLDIAPVEYSTNDFSKVEGIVTALYSTEHFLKTARNKIEVVHLLPVKNDQILQAFLKSSLINQRSGGFAWRFNIHAIHESLPNFRIFHSSSICDKNHIFHNPSLFLKGGSSNYIQTRHLSEIAHFFPNYYLHTVRNAGHWLHAEKPKETVDSVAKLIQACY